MSIFELFILLLLLFKNVNEKIIPQNEYYTFKFKFEFWVIFNFPDMVKQEIYMC